MSDPSATSDLQELSKRADEAARAWAALEQAGGLVSISEIAERWGVEKQTVRNHHQRSDDFPAPVVTRGRSDLWLTAEIDRWRATPRKRGRPPKKPSS